VHGAAGDLGTAACQLAAAYGARVIAVVSTPGKGEVARAAGAHDVVPVHIHPMWCRTGRRRESASPTHAPFEPGLTATVA